MAKDWQRVEELFHKGREMPPGERNAFLADACGSDSDLQEEVEGLLAADGLDTALPAPFVGERDLDADARFDRYRIISRCGQGANGTVYRAQDSLSGKDVAIKIFPPFPSAQQRRRYLKEARATASLHHPNIARVQCIGATGGRDYLVMDFVEGRTLSEAIPKSGLPLAEALELADMLLDGLAAAHNAGIIHRDLKPANVMLDSNGAVRILDFGLAKMMEGVADSPGSASSAGPASSNSDEQMTASLKTATGQIIGTACYLSPEQAEGLPVDFRSDVFSFGVVLYEMLTGERPFDRGSLAGTLSAILRDTAPPVRKLRPGTPRYLARLVEKCLEKDRGKRYASASQVLAELRACQARLQSPQFRLLRSLRKPRIFVPAVGLLLACTAGAAFLGARWMRLRSIRNVTEPQIEQLVEQRRYSAADILVHQIEQTVPGDPIVREFKRNNPFSTTVNTDPPGAEIAIQDYSTPDAPWRVLGNGPLRNIAISMGYFRWRVRAPGYRTRYFAETAVLQPLIHFTLYADAGSPQEMELIPEGGVTLNRKPEKVPAFWLDRFEVTNRRYLEFVKAGGYRKREYWKETAARDGRTLTWEQEMDTFRDQTGQLAPAGWEHESYPEGKADFPVTGVSWYEAAAYARFAGKSLPTYAHWLRAAASEPVYADSVLTANFARKSLASVGSYRALERYGTYDLAGNAKEWLWNDTKERRLAMGGGWDEPYYMSKLPDALPPLERRPTVGFRCAKYDEPVPPAFLDSVTFGPVRDYNREKPVDDAVFAEYRKLYDYPPAALHPSLDATDDSDPSWHKLRVSFDAAYGNQRVTAYLFLPAAGAPPYQTILYYPSGISNSELSSSRLEMWSGITGILRSGRAVLYPVLWGTYERHEKAPVKGAARQRMEVIRQVQDLRRCVDYLDTRSDIDHDRLGIYGFSGGAALLPMAAAVEPRLKVLILAVGGFAMSQRPPEIDAINFVPRVRVPVLMMNGRYDVLFEVASSQQPMLELFGAKPADKKLYLVESGHAMVGYPATARESLAWLDRYLGPVRAPATRP